MRDLFARDTEIAVLIVIAAAVILLLQLILCFKAKKLLPKLLPAGILLSSALVFYGLMFAVKNWSGFLYGILAVVSGVLLLFCGLAWGIWAAVKRIGKLCAKA